MYDKFVDFYDDYLKIHNNGDSWLIDNIKLFINVDK